MLMTCKWCAEGYPFDGESQGTIHAVGDVGGATYTLEPCTDATFPPVMTEAQASAEARALVEGMHLRAEAEALEQATAALEAGEPLEPHPIDPVALSFDVGSKDTNPKDGIGATKIPLHLVPVTAIAYAALAHHNGRGKYGAWNWRVSGVRASIYLDACFRHLNRWIHGEEVDPEDGVPNLGGALACINILIDSRACGKLVDDRPPSFDVAKFFADLTPLVGALNAAHADRKPRHYTIADTECPGCGQEESAAAERDEARGMFLGLERQIETLRDALRASARNGNVPSVRVALETVADEIDAIVNPKTETKGAARGNA